MVHRCLINTYSVIIHNIGHEIPLGAYRFRRGYEAQGACRGADYLVNTTANFIVANEDNYALAA